MTLQEMMKARATALAKAESIIALGETSGRVLTDAENADADAAMAEVTALNPQIARVEKLNTLRAAFPAGRVIVDAQPGTVRRNAHRAAWRTEEYANAFQDFAASRGRITPDALALGADSEGGYKFPGMSAVAYEGNSTDGAPIVPSVVEQIIIPLSPPVMGVEALATVIPTTMDLKFPRKTAHGTGAYKAQDGSSSFTGTDPTMEQFTLGAYMIGHPEDASWELLQDVAVFQSFMTQDILLSLAVLKENWYVNGTGTNQAEGLIGNTGTGVTGVLVGSDNYGSELLQATLDVQADLNPVYDPNSAWLMQKATAIALRKAQLTANLFFPVFQSVNGVDYLHGRPVAYSYAMPAIAAGNTPILFGDFKAGYIIGERGGPGVNVKILDQPKALQGLLTVLGYQRVDGRIRRSEAIQAITLNS